MGFTEFAFGQHHGGEQAPPISFGSGETTVITEIFPPDFDPQVNSDVDLRIRFFDTNTGINIENVSYRVKIFHNYSLLANQMFFDKDGFLEVKVQPKSECDQDELWRCTKYHGEMDPIVPNALTSSTLSKPVITGPVFNKSGDYTLEVSIIGAKNPKTQTAEDITFQTKIIIPSSEMFTVVSNDQIYQISVKTFQEKLSEFAFDEPSKSFFLQMPLDLSHNTHVEEIKTIIEIPKGFPPFKAINDFSVQLNGNHISTQVVHYDDVSRKDVNMIHILIPENDLKNLSKESSNLEITVKPSEKSYKIKKEIIFENGYKARVSHDTEFNESNESFFTISFFDPEDNIIPNIRYGYSIKDPNGKEIVNTGSNTNIMGINVPNGLDTRYLKTEHYGVYEINIVLIGTNSKNFDEFVFQKYNFEMIEVGTSKKQNIPEWVKNNARWWAEDQIDEDSFVQGIQFMIKNKIITLPETIGGSQNSSEGIPDWVKNNARWWAEEQIDEDSFVQGIQFLIKIGIIKIN